jgi:hypothetical protein
MAGLIEPRELKPCPITGWRTTEVRRAFLVETFRPADIAPGLKTRRLDRLSIWSLVATWLALKDSGIDLDQLDGSRAAVVVATSLGCIELTEAYLRSAHDNGWFQTDPILFPETLGNSPAGHVARQFGFRGPNITVSTTGLAGECALLQAASVLRHGLADLAVVLAGDTLTRTSYEWYEAAGLLSRSCFDPEQAPDKAGIVPSEGITAMVVEAVDSRHHRNAVRSYAGLGACHFTSGPEPAAVVRKVLPATSMHGRAICCADLEHGVDPGAMAAIRDVLGESIPVHPPDAISRGLPGTGALLRLTLALREPLRAVHLLFLSGAPGRFSAILLELP